MINSEIKIGTDFSGIGSPEQALIKLGVKHKSMFACDFDKYAKQSYLANYSPEIFYDDVTKRNHKEAPYVDLYVAGFPCQAFSIAGNRDGFEDSRGTLFFDLLQYLKAKRPKYFILENVRGLTNHDNGQTFKVIIDALAKTVNKEVRGGLFAEQQVPNLGYHIYYKILNTRDFGIPQNRERIFIVGFRDDKHSFKFPKEMPLKIKLKDLLEEREVDEKFYLKDETVKKLIEYTKRNKENGNGFGAKFHDIEKDVMSSLKVGGTGADDLITVHSLYPRSGNPKQGGTGHLKKKDGTTYCIDTGNCQAIEVDSNKDIIQIGNIVDTGNFDNPQRGRIYSKEGISPALNTCGGGGLEPKIVHKKRIRRLTPLECLRLQGFPDDFYYKCKEEGLSDTQLYKQAGNSMTVDVMYYLIKQILKNEENISD
jgi:DNA (cytosine-5)-methyltransferase 1